MFEHILAVMFGPVFNLARCHAGSLKLPAENTVASAFKDRDVHQQCSFYCRAKQSMWTARQIKCRSFPPTALDLACAHSKATTVGLINTRTTHLSEC